MITRLSQTTYRLEVNEYIEKYSEIAAHVKEILNSPVDEVEFHNDGCNKSSVVLRIFRELHAHGIKTYTK